MLTIPQKFGFINLVIMQIDHRPGILINFFFQASLILIFLCP